MCTWHTLTYTWHNCNKHTLIILNLHLAKSYFGSPIECISKDDVGSHPKMPLKLLNTYCWITTTFSVEKAWHKKVGEEVPYPGIDKYTPNEKRTYHAYYQWVCFVLFFQALLFYVPRVLWKTVEGGRIKDLVAGLGNDKTKDDARAKLVRYLHASMYSHGSKFWIYILMEVLNFLNVVIQMIIMDEFLNNEFTTYGVDVMRFTEWDWAVRYDPMLKIFPRMTKCTFHRYGSSGDVQKHDALCLLPVNIIHEKIYIFLWFWFYFVALVSLFGLVYRLVTIFSARVRYMSTYSRRPIKNSEARNAFQSVIS